jgi:hypothetical protein
MSSCNDPATNRAPDLFLTSAIKPERRYLIAMPEIYNSNHHIKQIVINQRYNR